MITSSGEAFGRLSSPLAVPAAAAAADALTLLLALLLLLLSLEQKISCRSSSPYKHMRSTNSTVRLAAARVALFVQRCRSHTQSLVVSAEQHCAKTV
jgi:hypothetical protein